MMEVRLYVEYQTSMLMMENKNVTKAMEAST